VDFDDAGHQAVAVDNGQVGRDADVGDGLALLPRLDAGGEELGGLVVDQVQGADDGSLLGGPFDAAIGTGHVAHGTGAPPEVVGAGVIHEGGGSFEKGDGFFQHRGGIGKAVERLAGLDDGDLEDVGGGLAGDGRLRHLDRADLCGGLAGGLGRWDGDLR